MSLRLTLVTVFGGFLAAAGTIPSRATEAHFQGQAMAFGKTADGTSVEMFTLQNAGITAKLIAYGATLTELHVPDKGGKTADIVLGFDNMKDYLADHDYIGATVGRVANRIAKGRFALEGKTYTLATNNGPNHLHGGLKGFDKVVWKAISVQGSEGPGVKFIYNSPDGEEGYPGNVDISVTYVLTKQKELKIEYQAITNKPTPVNLTNHSYFNLAGAGVSDILGQELMIAADKYTPVNDTLIPTGEIESVKGTPLDFTKPTPIGQRIAAMKGDPGGYDHNFVLRGETRPLGLAARVKEPNSGRVMEVWTTEPGLQFYSGNFLNGKLKGKGGSVYRKHFGFCLEAQHFPDSVNHPNFPSIILRPGQTYRQTTVHRFSAE